ncbi:ADP-ribose pyrophosphatase [Tersicoccus solisilvae]|uniref:ADP-ribose pyrophosphatase n=1 Tax=Tersicoccus solisilvae TaxID=1882339 RepID=A0ABQ1NRQ3_9MICC|nr:NUDIX hydrolase [Tersicoccus solisilvae]GGC78457.1 ADP-ribose pyrophosphatase [Tersicoccus solisilvae]
MAVPEIHFCRRCGHAVEQRIPPLEDRSRAVCPHCGYVDYVNPLNVVGTVPVWTGEDGQPRILLCRRAIEPRRGYWTLPAGFMEVGETAAEGAARETREEAGARIELEGLFAVLDAVRVRQVHLFYRARLLDLDLAPGPETIENALVGLDEIPWDRLAFHSVRRVLQDWIDDHRRGRFDVHTGSVERTR